MGCSNEHKLQSNNCCFLCRACVSVLKAMCGTLQVSELSPYTAAHQTCVFVGQCASVYMNGYASVSVYMSDCVCGCALTNVHMLGAYIECHKGYNKSSGAEGLIIQQWSSAVSSFPRRDQRSPPHHKTHRGQVCVAISLFLMGKQPRWNMTASDEVVMYIRESSLAQWAWGGRVFSLLNKKSILNSLPHLLLRANSCEALKSYLIIKHEKPWIIEYYKM